MAELSPAVVEEAAITDRKADGDFDDACYKIIFVGPSASGKTSLINRLAINDFNANYKTTVGVDCLPVRFRLEKYGQVTLSLWDIAGQDRFSRLARIFVDKAAAAIVVTDISHNTLDKTQKWIDEVKEKTAAADGTPIPTYLLANKKDLDSRDGRPSQDFLDSNNFDGYFETSAKMQKDPEIWRAVAKILNRLLRPPDDERTDDRQDIEAENLNKVSIIGQQNNQQTKRSGCC
eukprot:gb/GECH01014007.1/.p1 GENE.gb/GECH01014007.1/~~gb/GECH01014007.1/.p1  ORF type:complete len:233 (+),score=65.55 gb/GECH01014007.1/:1-699(+)